VAPHQAIRKQAPTGFVECPKSGGMPRFGGSELVREKGLRGFMAWRYPAAS